MKRPEPLVFRWTKIPVDDHPNHVLDVTSLLESGTTPGVLDSDEDRDVFLRSVRVGEKVRIGLASDIDARLTLRRENAPQQTISRGESVQISADADEEIELRVSSSRKETGPYEITYEIVADDHADIFLPTNHEFTIGQTIIGTLENDADVDRFLIDFLEGQRLDVELDWDGQPGIFVEASPLTVGGTVFSARGQQYQARVGDSYL